MIPSASVWQCVRIEGDEVVVRVRHETTARELLQALLESKATAKRVLARGQLRLSDRILGGGDALPEGALVTLHLMREACPSNGVGPLPTVVFQDSLLLAADKPAGLLVHGDGNAADTLTAHVTRLLAQQGASAKVQAVQRLDTQTTGIVLFSLAEEFQPMLDAQVAGHDMRKRYLAVTKGRLPGSNDWVTLDGPIARDRHDARKMRVGATGKPALTRVRTLAERKGYSLVQIELLTGRKHQIRVHLAHAGHPIVGDTLYGGPRHKDGLMLHAWSEQVVHPLTRETLTLQTPVPARFTELFSSWRF